MKRLELFRRTRALLFAILWDKSFGLATIEVMDSGTPIIAFNQGAAIAIIQYGETGFIMPDMGAMCPSVRKIDVMSF